MFSVLLTLTLAADPAAGHLVAVGGGTTTDVIARRTLEIAGGASARILVIPQASATRTGEGSVAMWRECGANDRPQLLGVGIDENTAAVVGESTFEVIGAGQVLVIDARKAKASPGKKGDLAAAEGVTLHVLTPGMTFTVK